MSKRSEGIVLEIKGEYAVVMATSHSGCDATYCCQGEGVSKTSAEMINPVHAVQGDKVIFEVKENSMLLAAFIVYVMPLILAFTGAGIGSYLSPTLHLGSTLSAVIGAAIFFAIALVIVKAYDNFAANSDNMKPIILSIEK